MAQGFQLRDEAAAGVRIAAEKSQQPDECTTNSQFTAGAGISISRPGGPEWPIIISAVSDGAPVTVPRQLAFTFVPQNRPSAGAGLNWVSGDEAISIETVAYDTQPVGDAGTNTHRYGTAFYFDFSHNWGLTNNNNLLVTLVDISVATSSGPITPPTVYSHPKHVGIDADTVRIYVTYPRLANELFGEVIPKYRITLQEVL